MTSFTIKMIAIATMIIDHAGAVFDLNDITRLIGRIAFPLFVYLIAEGCKHTKSMEKYLIRLGMFAIISQIPFDLAFNDGDINFVSGTNIFYTLFLGVFCIFLCYRKLNHFPKHYWLTNRTLCDVFLQKVKYISKVQAILFVSATALAAEWLGADYGSLGVLFIIAMYVAPTKVWKMSIMSVFMLLFYFASVGMLLASLIAVVVIAMSNNQQGFNTKHLKWLFYIIYPVHLLLFAFLNHL